MSLKTEEKFKVAVVGDLTGTPYNGEFTVKTMPSFQDEMDFDSFYAEVLGARPVGYQPSVLVHNYAFMLAFVRSRLLSAPDWYTKNRNGLDIPKGDLNVITEIFNKTSQAELKNEKDIEKAAETVKATLKKNPKE
jgi:hypothetical protein